MCLSKFIFGHFYLIVPVKYKENQQKQPGPNFRAFSSLDICQQSPAARPWRRAPFWRCASDRSVAPSETLNL